MIQHDTIKLLRECDSGVQMGISSIDEVFPNVCSDSMKQCLDRCRKEHSRLNDEIQDYLHQSCDQGKEPSPILKGMSWIKTNMMLGMDDSDQTIAGLMTDGCNMGVKSLSRYLNEYKAADEYSKDIAKRLIKQEEQLAIDMRSFL